MVEERERESNAVQKQEKDDSLEEVWCPYHPSLAPHH